MAAEHHGVDLLPIITLLGAGVVSAPAFKRLGLGAVLGYLAAGMAIGPFGLRLFADPAAILQVAELGVVLFLFLVGLEMRPSRLWALRRSLFGIGLVQVVACAAALTTFGVASGIPAGMAFVAGSGFVLSSTAIVMQLLQERGELASPVGQRIFAVLLLEDLLIVPLLAAVAFLAPAAAGGASVNGGLHLGAIAIGVAGIVGLVAAGRWLLNPFFRLLAGAQARDVMTAAALLVVLGAAYALEQGGLSMALGAFVAGVLLSESSYRHQLEADVEPFRGILLGLFFMAVGMSLDFGVVSTQWRTILLHVAAYMGIKSLVIYAVARAFHAAHDEALSRALYMAQGGEFAFVLYAAATSAGIVTTGQNALLTAVVVLSMGLTPLGVAGLRRLRRHQPASAEHQEPPPQLTGTALVIGFGRVGQIVSQILLARGYEISIIDTDVEMIDVARENDFKVYYGDGTRLDILHAAGAATAHVAVVCVDGTDDGTRITELLKAEHPHLPVLARARDRVHSLALLRAGADLQVRETFESAVLLGESALHALGVSVKEAADVVQRVRAQDRQRTSLERVGGIDAGRALFSGRSDA